MQVLEEFQRDNPDGIKVDITSFAIYQEEFKKIQR